jgi:2-dehydro-3-deoxyglucarate aldolase/4-hydroxy-2-oxoheptanedioate aldolase
MRENTVKRTLAAGGTVLGLMCAEFSTPGISRLADAAGADFVLYDMEHTGWSIETVKELLAASRGSACTPLVRISTLQRHMVSRPLDLGAAGVMVPMVESAEDARRIVELARFPPQGSRGVGVYYPDDIESSGLLDTLVRMNANQFLIAQIETAAGVEHAAEIIAVDGIDILWIGHFDLTTSLGVPGQFGHPLHVQAVDRVFAAADAAGKPVGTMANDVEDARALLSRGYRAVMYCDAMLFPAALGASLAAVRPRPAT